MKLPFIQLYPGDWLKDSITGCSLAAQGLWLRMMFIMNESDPRGYILQNNRPLPNEAIARRCGCSTEQYLVLVQELDSAGVPGKTKIGSSLGDQKSLDLMAPDTIIFSRRMVKDEQLRQVRSNAGRKGGQATCLSFAQAKVQANIAANPQQNTGTGTGTDPPPIFLSKGGPGENRRSPKIPADVEEVIRQGAAFHPPKTPDVCRAFFDFYESQRGVSPDGEIFWKTSSEAVITHWPAKLRSFGLDHQNNQRTNYAKPRPPDIDHKNTPFTTRKFGNAATQQP